MLAKTRRQAAGRVPADWTPKRELGRIVSCIEQDLATIPQPAQIEPSWPRWSSECRADGVHRHRNSLRVEQFEHPHGDDRIADLMSSSQSDRDVLIIA
jgi:hypothetical protein